MTNAGGIWDLTMNSCVFSQFWGVSNHNIDPNTKCGYNAVKAIYW